MSSPKTKVTRSIQTQLSMFMVDPEVSAKTVAILRDAGLVHRQRKVLTAAGVKLWREGGDMLIQRLLRNRASNAVKLAANVAANEVPTFTDQVSFEQFMDAEMAHADGSPCVPGIPCPDLREIAPFSHNIRSNSQLARAADTTPTMASRLRSGKRQPSITTAIKVMNALGASNGEFRDGMIAFAAGGAEQEAWFDRHMGRWGQTVG